MNDQERQVISDIFRRLEQVADQPRDPEAERLIAEKLRQQPYAPYAMAQAVYVQEQALNNLQAEVEALRTEIQQVRQQPQQGGGFLSGIFGGGSRPPEPSYRDAPQRGTPWGGQAQQPSYGQPQTGPWGGQQQGGPWGGGMMQSRGGGFLSGALSTAAGVAGGVMIANALSSAFGGGAEQAVQGLSDKATGLTDLANQNPGTDNASITDSLYQDQPDNVDDYSGFDSGGDEGDWT